MNRETVIMASLVVAFLNYWGLTGRLLSLFILVLIAKNHYNHCIKQNRYCMVGPGLEE